MLSKHLTDGRRGGVEGAETQRQGVLNQLQWSPLTRHESPLTHQSPAIFAMLSIPLDSEKMTRLRR